MGTRTAPLLLLLLTSCMASGGTGTTARDSDPVQARTGPVAGGTQASAATAARQSSTLPAIPRKRPDGAARNRAQEQPVPLAGSGANAGRRAAVPARRVAIPNAGKTGASGARSSGSVVSGGSAASGRQGGDGSGPVIPPDTGASGAIAAGMPGGGQGPADIAAAGRGAGGPPEDAEGRTLLPPRTGAGATREPASGDRSGAVSAATGRPAGGDAATTGAAVAPPSGEAAAAMDTGSPHAQGSGTAGMGERSASDVVAESNAAGTATGLPATSETELAIAAPIPEDRGIDVESLFDGDVVRYCEAMWQMGEYIGAARHRGEPFKQAMRDGVRRIASEKQLPLDNRLSFSGQVYGRLLYRLDDSHSARAYGAYVHFACLTVRGDKKIVPADPDAERDLNVGLRHCEGRAVTRHELNDCLFRELAPIVERRNG